MKSLIALSLFLLSFSSYAQTYCSPTFGSCLFGNYISNVVVGGINNTASGCLVWDYTSQVGNLTVGTPNPMTVTCAGWDGIAVFIDLNNNGVLNDPGELMYNNYTATGPPITYNFSFTIPAGTVSGNHRMRVMCGNGGSVSGNPDPCMGVQYGNYHDYTVYIPPSGANDVGISSIDSPSVFCPGIHNVVATIGNFGTNVIDSAKIYWSVDGVFQDSLNFIGTLDTAGGTGSATASVFLGSYNFSTNNVYSVAAWTRMPNGVQDTITGNDSTIAGLQSNLPPPSNITLTAVQGNQASLSWSGGSSNSWLWVNVPQGNPLVGAGTPSSIPSTTVTGLSSETDYDFYVREVCPTGDTSAWAGPFTYTTPFLCPPNAFCFLTGGASGRNGPSQSQLNTVYAGTPLAGAVTSVNGIQKWTLQSGGLYSIEVFGAQGGGSTSRPGGKGARMKGEFGLANGTVLNILVGQSGFINDVSAGNRGGGGGTFVWDSASPSQPLIVAGGGGGSNISVTSALLGLDAVTTTGGAARADGAGSPGSAGNGASPGGAGFLSNSSNEDSGVPALSALNGGTGGDGYTASTHYGGFGGGGGGGGSPSTTYGSGGGGGYSGGAGQGAPGSVGGGGGGSYNSGANQDNLAGVRSNDGVVIITPLSSGISNDAGVVSVDLPASFCEDSMNVPATILNYGVSQINSVTINWEVNGNLMPPVNYNSLLDTFGGSGSSSAQVILGSVSFQAGSPIIVRAWTSDPNSSPDGLPANDSSETTVDPLSQAVVSSTQGDEACEIGNLTLSVVTNADSREWFDDPALTNLVGTGDTIVLLGATSSQTLYFHGTNTNGCDALPVSVTGIISRTPNSDFTYVINGPTVDFTNTITGSFDSVLWDFGDFTTSNTTDPSHTYTSTGTRIVRLTAYEGSCLDDTAQPVFVFVAIDDQLFKESINIYPNPSSGKFVLDVQESLGTVYLEILNMKGERVFSDILTSSEHSRTEIDISAEAAGNYLIKVSDGLRESIIRISIK